ncbi:MAG: hypothetical protein VXZ09_17315, partial [Pseudomonadota bacterium]|nr:hypothetical protein [Pseudomonadota bacterium]
MAAMTSPARIIVQVRLHEAELTPPSCLYQEGISMTDTQKTAQLSLNGETYELPIFSPTAGPDVLDIR